MSSPTRRRDVPRRQRRDKKSRSFWLPLEGLGIALAVVTVLLFLSVLTAEVLSKDKAKTATDVFEELVWAVVVLFPLLWVIFRTPPRSLLRLIMRLLWLLRRLGRRK